MNEPHSQVAEPQYRIADIRSECGELHSQSREPRSELDEPHSGIGASQCGLYHSEVVEVLVPEGLEIVEDHDVITDSSLQNQSPAVIVFKLENDSGDVKDGVPAKKFRVS